MLRLATLGLLALPASAVLAEGHAVGLKVGAFGLGAEYTYDLTERISLRGALYGSNLGFDAEESGIEYEADVVWDSLTAGVDFHPMKSALRLSVGFMRNDNALELFSRPTTNQEIGDTTYTPSQIGSLTGSLRFDDSAAFAGLGWDWSRDKSLFGMSLDLGVVDQGDPIVTLRGSGSLLGNPAFEQDINAEAAELAAEASVFDLVPYLSLGFQFRF